MKCLVFFLLGFSWLHGQTTLSIWSNGSMPSTDLNPSRRVFFPELTDWYVVDTLNAGDDACAHEWLNSEPYSYGGRFMSCGVIHLAGERCSWTIQTRKSICKKCLMHIIETDENPNPPKPKPEPVETYEILLEKLKKN